MALAAPVLASWLVISCCFCSQFFRYKSLEPLFIAVSFARLMRGVVHNIFLSYFSISTQDRTSSLRDYAEVWQKCLSMIVVNDNNDGISYTGSYITGTNKQLSICQFTSYTYVCSKRWSFHLRNEIHPNIMYISTRNLFCFIHPKAI